MQRIANAAKRAGASEFAIGTLTDEATLTKKRAKEGRRPGAKLDSAHAAVVRAEDALQAAEEAVQLALAARDQAAEDLKEEQRVAADLEAEITNKRKPNPLTVSLLTSVYDLISVLEQTPFSELPTPVREAMETVHASLGTDEKAAEEEEEEEEREEEDVDTRDEVGSQMTTEDEVMEELEQADEEDERQLILIARRLKQTRSSSSQPHSGMAMAKVKQQRTS